MKRLRPVLLRWTAGTKKETVNLEVVGFCLTATAILKSNSPFLFWTLIGDVSLLTRLICKITDDKPFYISICVAICFLLKMKSPSLDLFDLIRSDAPLNLKRASLVNLFIILICVIIETTVAPRICSILQVKNASIDLSSTLIGVRFGTLRSFKENALCLTLIALEATIILAFLFSVASIDTY